MAVLVGISECALSRELSRNTSDDGYYAESAHILIAQRKITARKFSKTDERHIPIITRGLLLGWFPENIRCRMKRRTMIPKRVGISDRSEVVDLRSRLSDWKSDTVYGQDAYPLLTV